MRRWQRGGGGDDGGRWPSIMYCLTAEGRNLSTQIEAFQRSVMLDSKLLSPGSFRGKSEIFSSRACTLRS